MNKILYLSAVCLGLCFISCKKDKKELTPEEPTPTGPTYNVPTTYNFSVMSYSSQTMRMEMLDEMVNYMKTARTPNTVLSATTLKNMFSNSGSPFSNAALNTSGKQLESKFYALDVNIVKGYMDSIAAISTSSLNIYTSTTDNTKKYVISKNGIDYTEMIEKLSMGAIFYYQAMETYICANGVGAAVNNSSVTPGEGTDMEHHWDEGFGYLGVPVNFPTNTTGVIFWGEYLDEVGLVLGNRSTLMNAFIKGRAAISNQDYTTRDAQISIINTEWEKLIAASAIHELNGAKANVTDNALRNHVLSEARGFIMCLKYKTAKVITQSQIDNCITIMGSNNNNITLTAINQVIDELANAYGMQSIKGSL